MTSWQIFKAETEFGFGIHSGRTLEKNGKMQGQGTFTYDNEASVKLKDLLR